MPRGQPEVGSGSSQNRRLSCPRSMQSQQESTELTKSLQLATSTSRKHGRHGDGSHAEGPSKRAKLHRNSEPPMRKDTTTIPGNEQKKKRKRVNKHKASRASNYHELKESNRILARQLRDTEQALKDTKQDRQSNIAELFRKICVEKFEEISKKNLTIITNHEELQSLKALADDPINGIQALQDSCRKKDEILKEKDAIIATKQAEIDACRLVIDKNGSWNTKVKQREDNAKEKLKLQRKAVTSLEKNKLDLEQRCTSLEANLRAQVDESNEMIIRLQQELQDSRPQSQRFNFKVSDEIVKQGFNNLESKVRQFVDKHLRVIHNVTDEELQNGWPSWSPQLRKLLATPLLGGLALEGYIWECLLNRVFTPWSQIWPSEFGQSLEKSLFIAGEQIEHAGLGSELYADYQHWRSSSSSFIGRLIGEDFPPESFDSEVEAMIMSLAKLCGEDVTHDMKADAMDVFKDARDFELQLRMLKAAYRFRMCKSVPGKGKVKYGMAFDTEAMIDRSQSRISKTSAEVPKVDFIMSPGLHKRGNNDGERYETDTWLIKMGVVCNAARLLSNSGSFITTQKTSVQTQEAFCSGRVEQEDKGQDTALQYDTGSAANGNKAETPIEIKDTDSCDELDPLSIPGLTHDSPSGRSHDSAQMQSGTSAHMVTRSQASMKTHISVDDGKLSNKPGNNHL